MANNIIFDTTELQDPFTHISNGTVDDAELKPELLGVMTLINRYKNLPSYTLTVENLAQKCNCSRNRMGKLIRELETHGYITRDIKRNSVGKFDTVFHVHPDPKGILEKRHKKKEPKAEGPEQLTFEGAPTKEVKPNKNSKYEEEFEKVWKLYPRKEKKKDACKAYVKARKAGTSREVIEAGVKAYAEKVEAEKTPEMYRTKGGNWFRGECWNDMIVDVAAPEGIEQVVGEIYKAVAHSNYMSLGADAKAKITKSKFEELQEIDPMDFCTNSKKYKKLIKEIIS